MQRAIGALTNITPVGANRHYTMSYAEFYRAFHSDPYLAGWFKPLCDDITLMSSTDRWVCITHLPLI